MRITFVLPGRSMRKPIGGFKVAYEYANGLVKRGHQVNVIHPLLLYPEEANLRQKLDMFSRWVASSVFGIPKLSWFDISPKVNMIIDPSLEERYVPSADVIITTAWQTAERVVGYSLAKGEKFYLIMDFYPWLGPRERLEATWRSPFKKVAISHWLYEKVIQAGGNNATVIPIGIDHQTFRLLADLANRPQRVTMLFSPVNYKASNDGLCALEICKKHYPDLEATFFGTTSPFRKIPNWVTYEKNVSVERLVKLLNQSRIYLCSSVVEGFAFPPAEAKACGCAVVSTDCGGIREYAKNEVTALLSPPKDPEALAQNLLRVLRDQNLCMRLARKGNEIIKTFTWDKAVNKMEAFLLGRLDKSPLS